ncbi:MAG: ribosome biogenesis/translation initiation ATPase RLI [Nanoarchaeota archaeon]
MSRIAIIEKEKCNPVGCDNYLCIRLCPVNRTGSECITKGDGRKAEIDAELCTGCGICPKRCPFGAIHIINLPDELDSKIIHRYGHNGFHLYNLPTPVFGKVVGILGRNAIGKSTALKILAGVLKPNMGEEKGASIDELIQFFKGSEAQNYFELLKKGNIQIAYKPQAIDQIPQMFKGKVKELLQKVDERKALDEVADALDLKTVLDHDIAKISGGELQRVAIAATALKKANLYLFDEPSSYMDIKQRIRLCHFIRSLAEEETAVMVIEHDLLVLDYMTDLVQIMYGKVGAYGIVSHPKATRSGINVYLAGFLRDENMRFRDEAITFEEKPPVKLRKRNPLVHWPTMENAFGSFNLKVDEGGINEQSLVGVLGANGIGKTSFVKILAGEVTPDTGNIKEKIKVAYKPQYLIATRDSVALVLKDAMAKFEVELMRPLRLKELLTKNLDELSGGELQRVFIAKALSQEAQLYLLDEPSAHLDVEDRLFVAKIIRNRIEQSGASTLIVDHDLLFVETLADDLIVFDGEPAKSGHLHGPFSMEEGMNSFLTDLNITLRRDPDSKRPRVNKEDSQKDREQKDAGKLYYS